jgi:hypothetical protein
MPQLLKKVEGEILTSVVGDVPFVISVTGNIQQEDFINLTGFSAFLQNFTKIDFTSALTKPLEYGLPKDNNIEMITLEISY